MIITSVTKEEAGVYDRRTDLVWGVSKGVIKEGVLKSGLRVFIFLILMIDLHTLILIITGLKAATGTLFYIKKRQNSSVIHFPPVSLKEKQKASKVGASTIFAFFQRFRTCPVLSHR